MSSEIVVAIITGLCAVVGQWLISRRQAKDRETADAVRDAKLEMRLLEVEKKLDVHNGYAEKFSEIGQDIAVIKTEIRTLFAKQ